MASGHNIIKRNIIQIQEIIYTQINEYYKQYYKI